MQFTPQSFKNTNPTLQKAIGYCLRILARKDYSRAEIIYKLEKKAYSESIIFEAIQYLESRDFINDKRLAQHIVNYYYGNRGKIFIQHMFQERKIPYEISNEILYNLPSEMNYLSTEQITSLKRILEKKYYITSWQEIDYTTKGKVFQYLVRKGFSQPITLLHYLTKNI